ncbi:MAG: hypothetical protein IJH00_00805 [Erysipelotrichaceae bacterium]|nr:hypothetical protein [Erysipelotrichaceae bacterium]MBQ6494117.1 hypothetical protein [Erysipelotrichaceae bacterium]
MLMILFGMFGLMLDLALSFVWLIIRVCFYLSPLWILIFLLRPRGYRRY